MSLFDRILTQPIFNLLAFVYNYIGDFGVAIIIVTVLIRLLLWPLVKKQLYQSRAMREIQPELKKIKAKANGNTMLESTMMMELYREKNIKPFSSMLVMIIQIPIMIAIFRVIQIFSGAAYNAANGTSPADFIYPFLAHLGRIPELLAGQHLSLLGIDLTKTVASYWPALMIAVLASAFQYYQSKQLMPDSGDRKRLRDILKDAANGQEVDQSDMMMATSRRMILVTPIMTFMIALALPGAVVLYYAVTSLVAILQQRYILNQSEDEMANLAGKKSILRRRSAAARKTNKVDLGKQAQEAVIVRKKDLSTTAKSASSSSGGKTIVRRIKAK